MDLPDGGALGAMLSSFIVGWKDGEKRIDPVCQQLVRHFRQVAQGDSVSRVNKNRIVAETAKDIVTGNLTPRKEPLSFEFTP